MQYSSKNRDLQGFIDYINNYKNLVVFIIVISAILFGTGMAYWTYKLPMLVNNIDKTVMMLKGDFDEDNMF